MDLDLIYKTFIDDETILTLSQLSSRFGLGRSRKYDKLRSALYEKFGKDHILGIYRSRLSKHRLSIRNSKIVSYSEESKARMSDSQKKIWKSSSKERRKLSGDLLRFEQKKSTTVESRQKSVETRRKNGWPGHTEKWLNAVTIANKNRVVSDETRQKMRLSAINRLEQHHGQLIPNYNIEACKLFEQINIKMGWNGIHAENGGEYSIADLGYWVDYYEPNLNLVIEYDESHHKNKRHISKDSRRQNQIENHLGCTFIRINENEKINSIIEKLNDRFKDNI